MTEQDYYAQGQKDGAKGKWRNIYSTFTKITTTSKAVKEQMSKNETAYNAGFEHGKSQKM